MRRLEAFWRTRASLIAKASGWLHAEHSRGIWSHLQQVSFIWQTHKHRDPYFQGGFLCFPTKREAKVPGPLSLLGGAGGGSRRSGRRRCAFLQWFPRAVGKCPACCSFRQSSTSSQSTSRSHEINVLGADLAIKCATHSGSNVGRKNLGSKVPEADTFGISRLSQARFAAIPNPPMHRRVYDEVCTAA